MDNNQDLGRRCEVISQDGCFVLQNYAVVYHLYYGPSAYMADAADYRLPEKAYLLN